jgi:hypothetical protein
MAQIAQEPEFNPQYCQGRKEGKEERLHYILSNTVEFRR